MPEVYGVIRMTGNEALHQFLIHPVDGMARRRTHPKRSTSLARMIRKRWLWLRGLVDGLDPDSGGTDITIGREVR
jgi:hypothetical protein